VGVFRTIDGGNTWNQISSRQNVASLHFRKDGGWAVDDASPLRTADEGKTWSPWYWRENRNRNLRAMHFATSTRGWAVGGEGAVLRTDDGGKSWTSQHERRSLEEELKAAGIDLVTAIRSQSPDQFPGRRGPVEGDFRVRQMIWVGDTMGWASGLFQPESE